MELADLTRDIRKKIKPEKLFFLQSRACPSFKKAVREKHFFRARKIVFLQSRASLSFIRAVQKKQLFVVLSSTTSGVELT